LSERVKGRVTRIRHVKWEESLIRIYNLLEKQPNIELPNTNSDYFYKYFNEKEEE
jgi:hypothetical protein